MRLKKKIVSIASVMALGVSLCSMGASAMENYQKSMARSSVDYGRFDLPVASTPGYTSSDKMEKVSSSSYADVDVTGYNNDTDVKARLRMRAYNVSKKKKATEFQKITGEGKYGLSYIVSAPTGDDYRLDADVSLDASKGTGAISGYWRP